MIIESPDGYAIADRFFPRTKWTREQVEYIDDILSGSSRIQESYDQGYSDGKEDAERAAYKA